MTYWAIRRNPGETESTDRCGAARHVGIDGSGLASLRVLVTSVDGQHRIPSDAPLSLIHRPPSPQVHHATPLFSVPLTSSRHRCPSPVREAGGRDESGAKHRDQGRQGTKEPWLLWETRTIPSPAREQTRPCRALRNVTWSRSVMMVFVMKPMAGERGGRNCERRVVRRCRGFPSGLICESSDLRRPSPQDPGAGVAGGIELLLYIQ